MNRLQVILYFETCILLFILLVQGMFERDDINYLTLNVTFVMMINN